MSPEIQNTQDSIQAHMKLKMMEDNSVVFPSVLTYKTSSLPYWNFLTLDLAAFSFYTSSFYVMALGNFGCLFSSYY